MSLGPGWAKSSIFSIFQKVFKNEGKPSYFHFRTTKISKFTHLDEKGAKVLNAKKMSKGPMWAKTSIFFYFSKSFQK